MEKPRCLQESIGSCGGCNVQNIVLEGRKSIPLKSEVILIERVESELCPDGNKMQIQQRVEHSIL